MLNRLLPECVILVDAENVSPTILTSLFRWLRPRFNVVKAIGFADFSQPALSGAESALRRLGITPRHVPSQRPGCSNRKNLVDSELIVEMLMIHAHDGHKLDTYVLVSGDGHFVPMVRALRADGKCVIVAAPSRSSSHSLRRTASRFFALVPPVHNSSAIRPRPNATVTAGRLQ